MARAIQAVVAVFTHYILPTGERVLRSGSHSLPEGAEEIKSGASYPAMMQWFARFFDDWAFRFIPLEMIEDVRDDDGNVITKAFDTISPVEGHSKFVTWTQDDKQVVLSVAGKGVKANIFKMLGFIILGVAKTPKRLKELSRLAYMVSTEKVEIKMVNHFPHAWTDGRGAIKLSYALKLLEACHDPATFKRMERKIKAGICVTVGYRLECELGQLKLELNIVPDGDFGRKHGFQYDLAIHADEWKQEFKLQQGYFAHAWPKEHTVGPAFGDTQTMSWMQSWLFAESQVRDWVSATFKQALDLISTGELPKWMEVELIQDEDGYEYARTTDLQDQAKQYVKWQLFGMKAMQSANLVYMAWLSLKQRALSRDLWVPVPYAGRYHVCTRTFVTELCGYTINARDERVVNFDPRVQCLVYHADLFIKLSDSHGGWDQDGDSVVLALRVTETGDIVGVCWRNPDSIGEYSVVKVDVDTIPVFFDDLPNIAMPSIVMANRPPTLAEVRATMKMKVLATPRKGKKPVWTMRFARSLFEAQKRNPFIGRVANVDMVMFSQNLLPGQHTGQPEDFPLEEKVDTCMGAPYLPAFQQIESQINLGWETVAAHGRVDRFFSGDLKARGAKRKVKGRIPSDVLEGLELYDGYFTRLHRFIVGEALAYGEELGKLSLQLRAANPIEEISQEGFFPGDEHTRSMVARGRKLIDWSNEQFTAVSRRYPSSLDEPVPWDENSGPINVARRSAANKEVVRTAASTLLRIDKADRVTVLVAAYRYCMEPNGTDIYGRTDRILYAFAGEGETSVMDLWLGVLTRMGIASPDAIERGILRDDLNARLDALFNQD